MVVVSVEGKLATEVAEAARTATQAIRTIQEYLYPPMTLTDAFSIRHLVEEQTKTLRWFETRGVGSVNPLILQGKILLGMVTGYEMLATRYFDPAAEMNPSQSSMSQMAHETARVVAASRDLRTAAIGYLSNVRALFGRLLEGLD